MSVKKETSTWHSLFIKILKKSYQEKKRKNVRYSMRQFAVKIGLRTGPVSEIFQDKRTVSLEKALNILEKLNVDTKIINKIRAEAKQPMSVDYKIPNSSEAEVAKDWISLAVLGLCEIDVHKVDVDFIASKILVSKDDIKSLLDQFVEQKLVSYDPTGGYRRAKDNWDFSQSLSKAELKDIKQKNLKFEAEQMFKIKSENRFFISYTFPGNVEHIEFLKKEIMSLISSVNAKSELDHKSELIRFSVQLFPFDFVSEEKVY